MPQVSFLWTEIFFFFFFLCFHFFFVSISFHLPTIRSVTFVAYAGRIGSCRSGTRLGHV